MENTEVAPEILMVRLNNFLDFRFFYSFCGGVVRSDPHPLMIEAWSCQKAFITYAHLNSADSALIILPRTQQPQHHLH